MSSHDKDPLEKQDSSDSSESSSDSEVNKAEENLEHLKIEERREKEETTDDSSKSYLFDHPSLIRTSTTKPDPQNEPVAGPSGIQKSCGVVSDDGSNPDPKVGLTDPQEQKHTGAEDDDESIEQKVEESSGTRKDEKGEDEMIEGDSDTTSSTPPFIQSSTGVTPSSQLDGKSSLPDDRVPPRDYAKFDARLLAYRFIGITSNRSSSSRRNDYATDSANTSADVSEIRSEIADSSAEGSVYHDAPEDFEKEESPSFVSALESREKSSEGSDTNYSELQDEIAPPPPTPESSSAYTSTPSDEQGHRAYLAQLQREADARGPPISSSSGIGSTNQSELEHRKAWELAGEMGYYRRNDDDVIDLPGPQMPGHGAEGREPEIASESKGDETESEKQVQSFDRLFEESVDEPNVPQDATSRRVTRRVQNVQESVEATGVGMPSPSKRRRQSKYPTETDKLQRFESDSGRKSKAAASKRSSSLQSGSGSSGPKSSSSDERLRKDSPEIKSESEVKESETGKKSWQNPGMLRKRQLAKMTSKDSVIAEEQEPELKETTEPALEKGSEGVATNIELSDQRPSIESSDQAHGSEDSSKEPELSFEVPEFERSVGKSKREPKLSSSPPSDEKPSSPSDEKQGSTPPKAATSRPKKKARAEKIPPKTRRTRHDSDGSVPKSVSLSNLQQSDSASTPDISDYTPSDEEKETAL